MAKLKREESVFVNMWEKFRARYRWLASGWRDDRKWWPQVTRVTVGVGAVVGPGDEVNDCRGHLHAVVLIHHDVYAFSPDWPRNEVVHPKVVRRANRYFCGVWNIGFKKYIFFFKESLTIKEPSQEEENRWLWTPFTWAGFSRLWRILIEGKGYLKKTCAMSC